MKNTSNLRNNNSATVAPTATDDSTLGYNVGSTWVDTTANEGYVCVDSSATAAIWSNISAAANLFTSNLNLLANRSHTLNDKEFKFDIDNSSTNIIGNSRFSSAGIVGYLNDTTTNVVNSYNINSTDITFIADSSTAYTSLVISPGSIALSEGSSDIAIDGISVSLSSGNGGLSIGSVGTANTLYQDNSTNKYGILLNGFGETSETNATGASYASLVGTSLVPKKYVDDAIASSGSTPALNNGEIYVGDASNAAQSVAMSGDTTIDNAGVVTIGNDKVTYPKMQDTTQAAILGTALGAGTVGEIPIIEQYLSAGTTVTLLENTSNWDVNGVYTGATITGTYQGQAHVNANYWFTATDDNVWIRLIRG
tara:strand:+ start:12793 stop:13893 length:1101 start_codon:yes stop_codon:yes gene_type:complete